MPATSLDRSFNDRCHRWALTCALSLISLAVSAGDTQADQPPVTATDVQTLLQRLEQAESRIQRLESELAETRPSPPQPFPGAASTAFDAPEAAADPSGRGDPARPQEHWQPASHDQFAEPSRDYDRLSQRQDALASQMNKVQSDLGTGRGLARIGDHTTMELSGRIHLDYWSFPYDDPGASVLEGQTGEPVSPQDRFGLRRLRFGAQGTVGEQGLYRFDLEFPTPPGFEFRDAYIGLQDLPLVQTVQVGNQKRPYGLDAINSTNFNIFLERPTVVEAFNTDIRRLGVQSWSHSEDLRWNWRYGLFSGVNVQNAGGSAIGDVYQLEFAGRLAQTWWYDEDSDGRGYGHHALAFTVAHPDGEAANNTARFATRIESRTTQRWLDTGLIAGARGYQLIGSEHVLNFGPLQAVGEVQNVFVQRDSGSDLHFWGGYGYLSYFLTGEHMPWDRETGQLARVEPCQNLFLVDRGDDGIESGWGAWQVAARYSYLDITHRDILGGVCNQSSLALVWYWNSRARVQLDWEHGWIIEQSKLVAAGLPDAEYDALGLRFAVDF